jgi:hypothetical protein
MAITAARKVRDQIVTTIHFLDELGNTLDGWADQTLGGGWSTHQVDANRAQANECRRQAATLRRMLEAT